MQQQPPAGAAAQAGAVAGAVVVPPPGGAAGAAAGGQAPVIFARAPAERAQDLLDYDRRNHYQTYVMGCTTLEDCPKFDCQEVNLKPFLDAFKNKEAFMGWVPLFTLMINGVQRHIPDTWGLVMLAEVHVAMTEHRPEPIKIRSWQASVSGCPCRMMPETR